MQVSFHCALAGSKSSLPFQVISKTCAQKARHFLQRQAPSRKTVLKLDPRPEAKTTNQ
jgi:hypothetical protein